MKVFNSLSICLLALAFAFASCGDTKKSDENADNTSPPANEVAKDKKSKDAPAMSEEEMMKAWEKAMTPDENHQFIGQMEGDWDASIKMWMDPSQEPQLGEGTSSKRMILGGRYLEEDHTGTNMGMPMEGKNLIAYDKINKEFRTVWIDTQGTGLMIGEGTREGNTLVTTATYPSVDPNKGEEKFRLDYTIEGPDRHVMKMYAEQGGEEFQTMEIVYTRQ